MAFAPAPMSATDPSATDPSAAPADSDVVVTICANGDGSYTVYAGDEPDPGGGADMSEEDTSAMGAAGAAPGGGMTGGGMTGGGMTGGGMTGGGQPADSIGAALKLVMDILQAARSSEGAPGNADDQLSAGFSADKSPTPAAGGPAQKY